MKPMFRVFTAAGEDYRAEHASCAQLNYRAAFKRMQRPKEGIASSSSALPPSLPSLPCFSVSAVNGKARKEAY